MGINPPVSNVDVGTYNSLKFDSSGNWQIAYYQVFPQPNQLRFGHQLSTATGNCGVSKHGQCDVIDSGINVGAWASLDLNNSDVPYIAYSGVGGVLRLAHKLTFGSGNCGPDSTWWCETIDSGVDSSNISLYVPKSSSSSDTIRIAYYDSTTGSLKYAVPVGSGGNCHSSGWECDIIDDVGFPSVDMGVSLGIWKGAPIIAYLNAKDVTHETILKIARPASGVGNCGPNGGLFYTWQCETVDYGFRGIHNLDNVGGFASLVVNPAGLVTIAYYDATSGDLDVVEERLQVFLPVIKH